MSSSTRNWITCPVLSALRAQFIPSKFCKFPSFSIKPEAGIHQWKCWEICQCICTKPLSCVAFQVHNSITLSLSVSSQVHRLAHRRSMHCEVIGHSHAPLHEGQWPKWMNHPYPSLSLLIFSDFLYFLLFDIYMSCVAKLIELIMVVRRYYKLSLWAISVCAVFWKVENLACCRTSCFVRKVQILAFVIRVFPFVVSSGLSCGGSDDCCSYYSAV